MKKFLPTLLAVFLSVCLPTASARTTTEEVGATKIHGGGYKCDSFEDTDFGQTPSTRAT